jgi:hypothetical protein
MNGVEMGSFRVLKSAVADTVPIDIDNFRLNRNTGVFIWERNGQKIPITNGKARVWEGQSRGPDIFHLGRSTLERNCERLIRRRHHPKRTSFFL